MAGSYFQILSAINLLEPYYGHPLLLLEYESAFNVLWQGLMKYCIVIQLVLLVSFCIMWSQVSLQLTTTFLQQFGTSATENPVV